MPDEHLTPPKLPHVAEPETAQAAATGENAGPQLEQTKASEMSITRRQKPKPRIELPPPYVAANHEPPMVTGVIVVSDEGRLKLTRSNVNHFFEQTYPRKEIVIVNATGVDVTDRTYPLAIELKIDPAEYPTIGALRNYGIRRASGDWIMPIDDDDHSHPHRIAFQMACRQHRQACVLLSHHFLVDIENVVIVIKEDKRGLPGTILFPNQENYYDESIEGPGEDEEFIKRCFDDNISICNNSPSWFPGPLLQICTWHGRNMKTREEFFGPYADPRYQGTRVPGVTEDHVRYLKHALSLYGLELHADTHKPEGPAQQELDPAYT